MNSPFKAVLAFLTSPQNSSSLSPLPSSKATLTWVGICYSSTSTSQHQNLLSVRVPQRDRTDSFKELTPTCDCGGWQVHSLQGRLAGWGPRRELHLESEMRSAGRHPSSFGDVSLFLRGLRMIGWGPPHYYRCSALLRVYWCANLV